MSSTDHMVILPKWVWIIKIVQAVLAVIILALSAYGVHYIPYAGYCYSIFTALYTAIILTYYFVTLHAWNAGYNWIAQLVLEVVAVIFWLSTWACLAVVYVAANADSTYSYDYYDYYYKLRKRDGTTWGAYLGVTIAAAVFSAIQWILFIITLVFLSIRIHRHRKAGMPASAGGPRTGTVANGGDVPAHGEPAMVMATGDNNSYHLQQQEVKNPQYQQYPASADQVPQYQQSPAIPQPYGATAPVSPQPTGSPHPPYAAQQPSPYAQQQQPYQPAVSPPPPNGHHEMQ